MSYATLAEFKRYAGIPVAETGNDTLHQELLDRASAAIDSYTRRAFAAAADSTRYFDAVRDVRGPRLQLDADLAAITSIANGDGSSVTSGQYATEPRNGAPYYALTLKASSGASWKRSTAGDSENAIAIAGKWGYSQTPPADIVEACLELAKFFGDARKLDANDLNRAVIAGNATILPATWPATVREALKPYRRLA